MRWPWQRRAVLPENPDTMEAGLARARGWAGPIRTVIDVGAAEGKWAAMARQVFPDAAILMVEPLAERTAELTEWARNDGNARLEACALGEAAREVAFYVSADLDGSGVCGPSEAGRAVPLETLDRLVAKHGLKGPFLVKLDTHGYELQILQGASGTLPETSVMVIEVYNFVINANAVRFAEITGRMQSLGFVCADVVDAMRRPSDQLLWQMDFFFGKACLPPFGRNGYSA